LHWSPGVKAVALTLLSILSTTACMVGEPNDDAVAGDGLDDMDQSGTKGDGVGTLARRTCPNGPTTQGIDVSYYQGNIDWARVKGSGIEFAFIRLSDGSRFRDPKFQQNWDGAKSAGVIRGAYQFFRPGQDVALQADMMIRAVGSYTPGDLPPVIDVEATSGMSATAIASRVRTWVDTVKNALHVTPIVYTGKYFWRDEVGGNSTFEGNPLWIAQYTSLCPDIPSPWTRWSFWQNSDKGSVAGVPGKVDTNKFNGTIDDLRAFVNGAPPPRTGALAFTWSHDTDGLYTFTADPPAGVARVEIRIEDYLIGASVPNSGKAVIEYTFNASREGRTIEVRGMDANGAVVAMGNGLIDSTDAPEVAVVQKGESDYEITLESTDARAATIEVNADGYPLMDSESGRYKSDRGAVRFAFTEPGVRELKVTARDAGGAVLYQETRSLQVR
jgi:lysozyme